MMTGASPKGRRSAPPKLVQAPLRTLKGMGRSVFPVRRKLAVVARLLRGEPLELVARETNVSVASPISIRAGTTLAPLNVPRSPKRPTALFNHRAAGGRSDARPDRYQSLASRRDLNFIGSMSGPVIPTDLNDRYQSLASRHDLNFIGSMSGPVTAKWSLMRRMVIWRPE